MNVADRNKSSMFLLICESVTSDEWGNGQSGIITKNKISSECRGLPFWASVEQWVVYVETSHRRHAGLQAATCLFAEGKSHQHDFRG